MRRLPEIADLLSLSARLGSNPLLVQASSGNTSIKLDRTLWIKASGKWLAQAADEDILVPVDLAGVRASLSSDAPMPPAGAWVNGSYLESSIETAMHGILPDRVVVHVHSVNAISWAVRLDGPERLAELLEGIRWSWIPYTPSGVPLARLIGKAVNKQPRTSVFILANHGLVVAGESCAAAEILLSEVERRLQVPVRWHGDSSSGPWLSLDLESERILRTGMLYPCQVVFLRTAYVIQKSHKLVLSHDITLSQRVVLQGLLDVLHRIKTDAPLRYLTDVEISNLLNNDTHQYRVCTEKNAVIPEFSTRTPANR